MQELLGTRAPTPSAARHLGQRLLNAAVQMYSCAIEGSALTPKERALILLCLDATATQLDTARLPQRIDDARSTGASDPEIVAVLHLTSLIGCHSIAIGGTILQEVLVERGESADARSLTTDQEEVVHQFETSGPWPRPMSDKLRAVMLQDTEHFVAMQAYINEAYSNPDFISPRMAHLVCIAIDGAPTHLYEPGLRVHIREALHLGATVAEITEVLQLASLRGWRSVVAGVDALRHDSIQ